jgi:hypothetical protein
MDLGALGLWIFIAAIVVAGIWRDARQKAEKHETLRRIVEKTGTIDEAKLKELFKEQASGEWKSGDGYRLLRILGTIVVFVGAGVATFVLLAAGLGQLFYGATFDGWFAALAISAGIAMLGFGIFFSSRFAEPPPTGNEPPAR